jgi:hypothetical protein
MKVRPFPWVPQEPRRVMTTRYADTLVEMTDMVKRAAPPHRIALNFPLALTASHPPHVIRLSNRWMMDYI